MAVTGMAEYANVLPQENPMPTRNVVLTDTQAEFVEYLVAAGRYQNASEVLREGLRLVQAREEEQAARLAAFREAVAVGIADMEAGRYSTFDDAASLRTHIAAIGKRALSSR
jgi:antitoxin ParD1/3/4